jgi:DNA replication protein DnaC
VRARFPFNKRSAILSNVTERSVERQVTGDQMVAAALIDRLVHHAQIVTLKGKRYRLKERGAGAVPAAQAPGLRPSA